LIYPTGVALTGGGAALTVIRRWRCAYHRLMAWIPPGSGEVVRTIYPTGGGADPAVALRVR